MKKLLFLIFLILFSCGKEKNGSVIKNEAKIQICDIPLLPVIDTNGILSSTPYDLEVQPQINENIRAIIYLEFKSKRISSPYWNGGVPFTTKQVVFDTSTIKYMPLFANYAYGRWGIRFTTDTAYFNNFIGYKDVINVVSNMVISDGSTVERNLFSGVSGVAIINSLFYPEVNEGFVFANIFPNTRYKKLDISSILVHEAGHMVGLYHQSEYDTNCSKIAEYKLGTFMGNPFYPYRGKWSVGPTPYGCNIFQDDTLKLNQNIGLK